MKTSKSMSVNHERLKPCKQKKKNWNIDLVGILRRAWYDAYLWHLRDITPHQGNSLVRQNGCWNRSLKKKRKKKVYSFSERLDCPCHWQSLYSNKFLCTPAKHYVYMLFSGSFPAKLDKLFWWYWLITAIVLVLCLLEEHEILWRGKIMDFRNKNSKIYNWVTEVYTNTTYIHF